MLFVVACLTLVLSACTSHGGSPPGGPTSSTSQTINSSPTRAAFVRLPEVLRGQSCVGLAEYRPPAVTGSRQELVPGSPGAAVGCVLPDSRAVLRGEQLRHFVSDLNALPRYHGRTKICPGPATGSVLYFIYASGDVQGVYVPSNCVGSVLTNGTFKAKVTLSVLQEIYSILGVEVG